MADTRNADLTYAADDYLVYVAPANTAPPTDMADPGASWTCLGWVTTDGGAFKMEEEKKDLKAAGSLEPIRTLRTGSTKTIDVTFEEALNPYVRALYDNVPLSDLEPTAGIAAYDFPDRPNDLKYAFVFDSADGDKRMRFYAPNGAVDSRGDEKAGTEDAAQVQMTMKFYRGATAPALRRVIDYGDVDVSAFFA
ncbi:phage tail tube protein [Kitasatospora fiedleri]|uniref:phage tail tube protein n=1 Tax=Kitasatospora fiedleri TaxID=2991545 RepID=UPI00249AAAA5|nr:phage tail protein [Kitasatospora fiedleri]